MKHALAPHIVISSYDDLHNPYYAGGGATAIHEVAKRLVSHYRVTVITGKYPGSKNKVLDGVNYERVGLAVGGPMLGQLAFSFCLPFLVLTKSFDLWFESFTPPFSTNCLQLFTRKPVIGLIHMLSGEDMRRKYKLPFDWFERIGVLTYRSFVVVSELVAKKVQNMNPKATVMVIPNGIETMPEEKAASRKNYILFLGRIEFNQKGLDLLLRAYAAVADVVNMPLYIAGTGKASDMEQLRKFIQRLHLSSKVSLLGRVIGKQKATLYREAKCVVLSSRFETFPLTALEAMSYGCPIITFDISGMAWIPSDCRIVVPDFSIERMSQALQQVVVDKVLRENLSQHALAFSKQFDWDEIAKRYEELIRKALGGVK
jgi:glycosyltransferase involved in cell wall biosynthesis